ncbi:MAG: hypothetical protein EON58_12370, partial [Alphaproteobacteria bacterium]
MSEKETLTGIPTRKVTDEADADLNRKPKSAAAAAVSNKPANANSVESDEVFTAQQRDSAPAIPSDVQQKYIQVGSKFYFPKTPDLVAFEDKGNKLETGSNSEAIAENMVRIAEARGWNEIKVSGSETFRREVWLEAATRHMHVKGYNPSEQDLAALSKRDKSVDPDFIERGKARFRASVNWTQSQRPQMTPSDAITPARPPISEAKDAAQGLQVAEEHALNLRRAETFKRELVPEAGTRVHPELAGSYAVAAAIERKAEADGLSPQ